MRNKAQTQWMAAVLAFGLCGAFLMLYMVPREAIFITYDPIPLSDGSIYVLEPSTGDDTISSGGATLDYSNCDEGYIMAKYSGFPNTIKLQITKRGGSTYTYDLNDNGTYEVFPLSSGSGSYTIGVFENVSGNQYAQLIKTSISVSLRSSLLPFLYPSQYVNFNADSATVKKSAELASNAQNQLAVISGVYDYVIKNIKYDTKKASDISSGVITTYLPKVDKIIESGKGICFDYAAVMAAMLRSQNIPAKLQVGYVSGGSYHAWISVYTSETGWINNMIQFDGKNWKMMDPTFAAGSNQSAEVMKFIGNGSNYNALYVY